MKIKKAISALMLSIFLGATTIPIISMAEILHSSKVEASNSKENNEKTEKKTRKYTQKGDIQKKILNDYKISEAICPVTKEKFKITNIRIRDNGKTNSYDIMCPLCFKKHSYKLSGNEENYLLTPSKAHIHKKVKACFEPNNDGQSYPCPFCRCQHIIKNGKNRSGTKQFKCSNPLCFRGFVLYSKSQDSNLCFCSTCKSNKNVFIINPKDKPEDREYYCYNCKKNFMCPFISVNKNLYQVI